MKENAKRPIYVIAREIRRDWKDVYFAAAPYLDAMESLDSVEDMFFFDSGYEIVARFLSNAKTWKGETAKRVKAELRSMIK